MNFSARVDVNSIKAKERRIDLGEGIVCACEGMK